MSLVLDRVCYSYPKSSDDVVSDFSLVVEESESAALVGPSGSGKSTVLALSGGLLVPDSGRVRIGRVPLLDGRHSGHSSRQVAWVLQNLRSLAGRSALDSVAVALLAQGKRRRDAEDAARESLAAVGLESLSCRRVEHLSGGQLQRVCVARAIAARPQVLLADEPTGQLDRDTSLIVVQALLTAIAKYDLALVMATHDLEIASMCDSTVRL